MISDYISKEERLACIRAGALSYAGQLDAELGPLPETKEAQVIDATNHVLNAAKSLALLATIGTGIPIGVFSHVIGRRIAGKRLREEELKEKIRLYRDASDEIAAGLGEGNS